MNWSRLFRRTKEPQSVDWDLAEAHHLWKMGEEWKCIWLHNQKHSSSLTYRQMFCVVWFEHSNCLHITVNVLMKRKVEVTQSCLTLCDPMDCTVHGILQGRILEWVDFPFSRGSSKPRDRTQVSHIADGFFTSWTTREAQEYWSGWPFPSPGHLPNLGIKLRSPAFQVDSLPTELSLNKCFSLLWNQLYRYVNIKLMVSWTESCLHGEESCSWSILQWNSLTEILM